MVAVTVVGSANLDIVIHLDRRPRAGETVFGAGHTRHSGGKGLNQAIAAAAVAPTALVAMLGDDPAGAMLAEELDRHGVDRTHVTVCPRASGCAYIQVTPDGENSIVVLPGANTALTAEAVTRALGALRPEVVLTQLETVPEVAAACARWAGAHGKRFLLNASPPGPVPAEALSAADPLIVNAAEARDLLGAGGGEPDLAARLARRCGSAVVTAGANGAFVADSAGVTHIPAIVVTAVDTTGAGDAFAGTVAADLASGMALRDAVRHAAARAAELIQLPRELR